MQYECDKNYHPKPNHNNQHAFLLIVYQLFLDRRFDEHAALQLAMSPRKLSDEGK